MIPDVHNKHDGHQARRALHRLPGAWQSTKTQALMTMAPNVFLNEVFDDGDEARIQKTIAFIDELRSKLVSRAQRS